MRHIFEAVFDYIRNIAHPPIEPEDLQPEWNDALDDYDEGRQEVDVRLERFDGRAIELVVPAFDPFNPYATDLYAAFAKS